MKTPISRRTMLKGVGTALALPWFESLAVAAPNTAAIAPKRIAFLYVPNGVNMSAWTPAGEGGKLGKLEGILEPLNPFKDKLNVLSGMTLDKGRANGDGPGDHARAMASFLTGRQPLKTAGADIRAGVSADQHLAQAIGDRTRFPSIELGIEGSRQAGNCDSGYSCAYNSTLSWRGESTPNAMEVNPKLAFERLFAGSDPKELKEARAKRELYNKSVLDFVEEDAKGLNKTLGSGDQKKLDEYLTSVRELEVRIEKMRQANSGPVKKPNVPMPGNTPGREQRREHIQVMCDLLVLAFQTDLTRIITLPFANDGSNHPYKQIEVPEGHHDLSHHGNDAAKLAKIKKINTFHTEQFAYLLGKLNAVKESNGTTLLDNAIVLYGSGLGDGNRHNHDDLPILLAGKGSGSLDTGRHIVYPKRADTPMMNLFLALFDRMGVPTQRFGDSTGKLSI